MPQIKQLKKLNGGQYSDLPSHEQPFEAFQKMQNCIPTAEGVKPLHALCDAVGPTISGVVGNTVGFPVTVVDDVGYLWTNNGVGGSSLYDTGIISYAADNHVTVQAPVIKATTAVTVTAWNTLTQAEQIAVMLKNIIIPYGEHIVFSNDITRQANGKLLDRVVKHYLLPSTGATGIMLDSDGSINGLAPIPHKFLAHDEYLLAIAGQDGYEHNSTTTNAAHAIAATVITIPSTLNMVIGDFVGVEQDDGTFHWTTVVSFVPNTSVTLTAGLTAASASGKPVFYATASLVEHRGYFRWNHPTAIDRWHPSTITPPDNLAGYKRHMARAGFVDAFIFNDTVYVLTEDNIHRFNKVGGETGYTMKTLNIHPKVGVGAINSVVCTSIAAFILTLEGLYIFNGQQMSPISAGQTEELFNKQWFRENISDTIYQEGGTIQSIQVGLHVPVVDCILWFVTYGTVGNETNMILVYNYETKTASYLLPPANEIWYPLHGSASGISVYDKTANTVRCFALRPKTSASIPPDANILLDSGFLTVEGTLRNLQLNRLFLELSPMIAGDLLSGLAVTVSGYNQKGLLHETVSFGLLGDGYLRHFLDERCSGRFVSVQISGSPNAWANYANNLNESLAMLKSIGVTVKPRGRRQ